jgi:branched-chain amino acid transport system permease protein/neutral amino acid transport system permease protein
VAVESDEGVTNSILIAAIGFGLVSAATIALAAIGFTLQAGISNIFNFAYGDILIASSYGGYVINQAGASIPLCILAGAVVGCVLSVAANRLIFVRFLNRGVSRFGMLIVCLWCGVVLQNFLQALFGAHFFTYNFTESGPVKALRGSGLLLNPTQLSVMALALVLILLLYVFLERTQLGQAMRATSSNSSLARVSGINTKRVIDITWAISGALCGIAGVVFAITVGAFQSTSGETFLVIVFAAAMLGGLGKPFGAALGALVVGVAEEVLAVYIQSDLKEIAAFGILVIILIFRPQGVFGRASSAKEAAA